ncbi:uncharacterized protein LOC127835298 isoform X2 [Dreissena polymorpha]|uniref:Uncharacterized protein n=2 Tax=Dreissena polymorpha TaxID=45954 RepID=A0A9D4G444_DREPO|nr:uncharacterized protein LOC127835298 isoform X2 [Dreissena polymorpha]XP_052217610.1 uncharacterized protein LOC127835298 isoform X2 [Dreissena polymorpha]XP_052217611.1 uncharacterized protein LOC127835298 isoform X2 [Dreissena polymorpha]XP_052217612.1 uncharacterized protein LOC127835298 isoform X2 [Dreissena polymorpha]XP_052217613.1 uncharacterized protein LOC127835298 isoform X2 [Dreissena polymorpha]KAH3810158.1 hypothetical protein DPMN_138544 [Dreissena polymorpha]
MTRVSPECSLSITSVHADNSVTEFAENSTHSANRTCSVSKKQKSAFGIIILVCVVLVVCVVVSIEVSRNRNKNNPPVNTVGTCTLTEYTMGKPLGVTCYVDSTVPADAFTDIDAKYTYLALDDRIISQVNCTFQASEGTLSCTGPIVTCLIRGTLSISLSDTGGNIVLSTKLDLRSPDHPLVTRVSQVFDLRDPNLSSIFTFTCEVTSSCCEFAMTVDVERFGYLSEDDAKFCTTTPMTNGGHNKSCVFEISDSVIRQNSSMDISCVLHQDDIVAKQHNFRLPACSDISSECDCAAPVTSCELICTKFEKCSNQYSERYQVISTNNNACDPFCVGKWCRDTFNNDKVVTITSDILKKMCPTYSK